MRIFRLGLEPLPERYTEQWEKWFPTELSRLGFEYNSIPGQTLSDSVDVGKVLDASGTMYYKFTQLQRVAELFKRNQIKNGDAFFIDDIQYPGIWSIRYMATLYKIKVYIFGFLHASSYTKEDFAEPMLPFMKSIEKSWLFTYDKIFVGSEYHKKKFLEKRFPHSYSHFASDKIVVSGAPWNVWSVQMLTYRSNLYKEGKEDKIIYSSRFDMEKRPNVFLLMADYIFNYLGIKDIEFVITTSRKKLTSDQNLLNMVEETLKRVPTLTVKTNLTKEEYYCELATSKLMVSTTIEENFGYCVVEALTLNTPVLVPNKYSHPELLDGLPKETKSKFLYPNYLDWSEYKSITSLPKIPTTSPDRSIMELANLALYFMKTNYNNLHESVLKYNTSIENMSNTMIECMEKINDHNG